MGIISWLMVLAGVIIVLYGLRGIKEKQIRTDFTTFTGNSAILAGIITVIIGAVLIVRFLFYMQF